MPYTKRDWLLIYTAHRAYRWSIDPDVARDVAGYQWGWWKRFTSPLRAAEMLEMVA
jgi:hypothetical protein